MILEAAEITVKAGCEEAFERAVARAVPLFLRAKGCLGVSLHRLVEGSSHYRLMVNWETLEDHTVHFRNSQDFQEWRRLVGGYFLAAPAVTHSQAVF